VFKVVINVVDLGSNSTWYYWGSLEPANPSKHVTDCHQLCSFCLFYGFFLNVFRFLYDFHLYNNNISCTVTDCHHLCSFIFCNHTLPKFRVYILFYSLLAHDLFILSGCLWVHRRWAICFVAYKLISPQ